MLLNKNNFEQPANRLLAALPATDYERLIPHLKLVSLPLRKILYEPGEPITQVYFPNKAVVSIINTMEDGSTVEVGLVSNEGMVGMPIILGDNTTTTTAFVQISDSAMQIDANIFRSEFNRGGAIQSVLLRYVQAVYTQIAQGSACNRLHRLEARLARWLLTVSDRLESDEFLLTQEFISQMLGVRRAGVTEAANILSEAGIITYHRGQINILNREALKKTSCECYHVIENEFVRLLANQPNQRQK
ncbi:MAG: Crp/Fnr family transcriptional regulator [Nostoc sp. DedVER02]|uniref:Crp/Fnr family transcriptional regulator n=1 Tax=unclassified Nostoc TaxID=2593658 RepID=UPI002AD4AB05|nr:MULTISPECIES: Crp/Fnr family transcriptional regulator [unclassified Nostoc]MDZ7986074.1 Crp/Fnr family transcriptional regulator [Nostoc sp. DedVER02]MDZ8114282.1 Crp/Fnr family transcriptional regulator [Nostoc sp. DedVER01b]